MHELSIAQNLIELLTDQLPAGTPERVGTIHVSIGQLSGVFPQALSNAFSVAVRGTLLEGANLKIQEIPPRVWCSQCQAERDVRAIHSMCCIKCGQPSNDVRAGRELQVESMEVHSL